MIIAPIKFWLNQIQMLYSIPGKISYRIEP